MDNTTWMNANKAVEFGFADDILTDEKRNPDTNEGYEFEASAVERTLINKISNKMKSKSNTTGRRVDDLKASLYKKLL